MTTMQLDLSRLRRELRLRTGDPSLLVHPAPPQSVGGDLWITFECACGRRKMVEINLELTPEPGMPEGAFEANVAAAVQGYLWRLVDDHAKLMHAEPDPRVN